MNPLPAYDNYRRNIMHSRIRTKRNTLSDPTKKSPDARAEISGSGAYPAIRGTVSFYSEKNGVLVVADIYGLPSGTQPCQSPVFGFHIHAGTSCTGTQADPFSNALGHYNPQGCDHPHHAGDLPPLFGNEGHAFSSVLTDRFTVEEIIGRTVIIHADPDDFTTQPSGNSGERIACGKIEALSESKKAGASRRR
jgi:Cu-Zn family superoxide dismutase